MFLISLAVGTCLEFEFWNFMVGAMRQFFLKFQLFFEAVILLATLGVVYLLIHNVPHRWDLTQEKAYSLPAATTGVLRDLQNQRIDVLVFYLQDDPARQGLEVFLKQCQLHHREFHYDFYDPNRRPTIARKFKITQPSTILIRSGNREERLVQPSEEAFTNAFLRLLHPKDMDVCFVTGHGEAPIDGTEPNGYQRFREMLEGYNAKPHAIVLAREHVPVSCEVVVMDGPRWELTPEELGDLKKAFESSKGVLLMVDPMDAGTGASFVNFFKTFGVVLGNNVIVDKVSRIAGGDFLMPLVSKYNMQHPITKNLKEATFFPLVRTVQPSTDMPADLEIVPLMMTSSGSWAETDLSALENGSALFDIKTDVAGPLPIAVAIEQTSDKLSAVSDKKKQFTAYNSAKQSPEGVPLTARGRIVMIGDSDFLANGYLNLAGNKEFGLRVVRWLGRDDRFIDVRRPELKFKPLLIEGSQRTEFLLAILLFYPLGFFILGGFYLMIRLKTS